MKKKPQSANNALLNAFLILNRDRALEGEFEED